METQVWTETVTATLDRGAWDLHHIKRNALMPSKFLKYTTIGTINTGIHWIIFLCMVNIFKYEQSISNFVAFISAVTFSFFTNSKLTFKKRPTATGYMIYIGIMGFLSILSGYIGDQCNTSPILTLISFSVISLVIGYFCAKYVVFKDKT